MNKLKLLFIISVIFGISILSCKKDNNQVVNNDQVVNLEVSWQKLLGGDSIEQLYAIQQTTEDGYVMAGWSLSNNGDVSGNHGYIDCWIVKLDSTGEIDWQKSLGGSKDDRAYSVQQTADGGYIVAGESTSDDGDVTVNKGSYDVWVVKLFSTGEIDWQKSFGGSKVDRARYIQQTFDGGYFVAGESDSDDGDYDYLVVKLTSTGEIEWQKLLGGSRYDKAYSAHQTVDGGYIVAGHSKSDNGDISGNHGYFDAWIVKLTSTGEIDWQKSLGGSQGDYANAVQQSNDGGYVVAGYSYSEEGSVSNGWYDAWIVKLTLTGEIDWQNIIGFGIPSSAHQTVDGGYIVAGGFSDGNRIVKLTSTGEIDWQYILGYSPAISAQQTTDGGFIVAGEHTNNYTDIDYWIMKLD